jgi:hypothetical protein
MLRTSDVRFSKGSSSQLEGRSEGVSVEDVTLEVGTAVGLAVGPAVGTAVGSTVGELVGVAVGKPVGTTVGTAVGTEEGVAVGIAVGVTVGVAVGTEVGVVVGIAVGVTEGVKVGSADGSYVGSGLNNTAHLMHDACKFCRPDTKAYTVSPVVCSVSSSTHWSSCVMMLALLWVRLNARRPVASVRLTLVPITPNRPGGVAYKYSNSTSNLMFVTSL